MKIQCVECGGRIEVDKTAVFLEGTADTGLALIAFITVTLGTAAIPSIVTALLLRKAIFKASKKSVGPIFKCNRCGNGASNKYILSQIVSK